MNRLPADRQAAAFDVEIGGGLQPRRSAIAAGVVAGGVSLVAGLLIAVGGAAAAAERGASAPSVRDETPAWTELKPAQQAILAPLRQEWPQLEIRSKRRWIEFAARFPTLGPDEQARVQARMTQWAHMTPAQRGEARLNFQEAKQLAPGDRKARWDAYQALPPEQKRQLADRSHRDIASAPGVVTLPAPRAIAPALVQATPGATTTLIDRRPTPPEHQRPGSRSGGAAAPAARRGTPGAASSPPVAEPSPPPASIGRPIADMPPPVR